MKSTTLQRIVVTLALAVVAAFVAAAAARAEGPRLYIPDVCIEPGTGSFLLPLKMSGEDRPSTLRATVMFDASVLRPVATEDAPAVHSGSSLVGQLVEFSHEVDADAGEVAVVVNRAGALPVKPLPEGTLAWIRLGFRPQAEIPPTLRVELDPGRTRSLDGEGRETFTFAERPAFVWTGQTTIELDVAPTAGDDASRVRTSGVVRERSAQVVRGRSSQLQRRGNAVTFSELEMLGDAVDGGAVEDDVRPEEGESFYYLAAQSDASGQPLLGFDSRCRGRRTDISQRD